MARGLCLLLTPIILVGSAAHIYSLMSKMKEVRALGCSSPLREKVYMSYIFCVCFPGVLSILCMVTLWVSKTYMWIWPASMGITSYLMEEWRFILLHFNAPQIATAEENKEAIVDILSRRTGRYRWSLFVCIPCCCVFANEAGLFTFNMGLARLLWGRLFIDYAYSVWESCAPLSASLTLARYGTQAVRILCTIIPMQSVGMTHRCLAKDTPLPRKLQKVLLTVGGLLAIQVQGACIDIVAQLFLGGVDDRDCYRTVTLAYLICLECFLLFIGFTSCYRSSDFDYWTSGVAQSVDDSYASLDISSSNYMDAMVAPPRRGSDRQRSGSGTTTSIITSESGRRAKRNKEVFVIDQDDGGRHSGEAQVLLQVDR